MKRFMNKKVAAIGLAAGLVLGIAGAATAYFTSSGTGTGSATTGTAASALKITDTTTITDMAPGVAAEPITGTIQNTQAPGGQNEQVNDVTVSIASVVETSTEIGLYGVQGSGNPGSSGSYYDCSSTDYNLSNAAMVVNQDLTPGQTVSFSGATIGFNDKTTTNQDACQGATVNLAYASN
jgi:hypothetical protein